MRRCRRVGTCGTNKSEPIVYQLEILMRLTLALMATAIEALARWLTYSLLRQAGRTKSYGNVCLSVRWLIRSSKSAGIPFARAPRSTPRSSSPGEDVQR
jgi:hypothetical protein